MDLDARTKKALFRFEIIAPLISGRLARQQLEIIRKQILEQVYTAPDGKEKAISERTLRDWVNRYKQKGFTGLFDFDRGTYGNCRAIPEKVLNEAIQLRKQESSLSIPQILDLLQYTDELKEKPIKLDKISASSLNRHLNKQGACKSKPRQEEGSFQRWQQKFVNDMWQGDCADGIWIPDPANPKKFKKTFFISFVDDASRIVPHAQFYWDTKLESLLDCFRKALLKRGKPGRIYCDNAWIYHSTTLKLLCAQLDIKPSFCTPKRPCGKGKIERQIKNAQEGFYKIAEHADIKTLDELNQFFFAWLTNKYHKVIHSALNRLSPLERWTQDKEYIKRVSPAEVRKGLMLRCERKVNRKTATIRLNNIEYQASIALAKEKVEVRFHFNDSSEIEIWQRGKFIEIAKPIIVLPNIDFSKRPSKAEETKRGIPYKTFKAYRLALVGNKSPEPSLNMSANEFITQQQFVDLFAQLLKRQLSEDDNDFLVKFFLRHAPLDRQAVQTGLEQTIEAAGTQLHLRAYCERLQ